MNLLLEHECYEKCIRFNGVDNINKLDILKPPNVHSRTADMEVLSSIFLSRAKTIIGKNWFLEYTITIVF